MRRYKAPGTIPKAEKSLPPGWFEEEEVDKQKKKKKNKKKKKAGDAGEVLLLRTIQNDYFVSLC